MAFNESERSETLQGQSLARFKSVAARCALMHLFAGACALSPIQAVAVLPCNPDNIPEPTVTITSPGTGAVLTPAPQNVPITVSIGVSGSTTKVVYYSSGTAIGTVTASPWNFIWTNVPAGTYSLQAKVTSTAVNCVGTSPFSTAVSIKVNAPPTVSIASPAAGTVSTEPGSFTFTPSASDPDGTVSNVQWFANGSAISGALATAPYSFAWSGVGSGSYSITARATDNNGATTTSAPITVVSNDRPTVALSPTGATTASPASITLQASPSDSVGGINNVQYFANGSAISGALTSAPFTFSWSGVGAGSYSIIARATDAYGATGDSAPYSYVVTAPITVSLTSPASGTVVNTGVPAAIPLMSNASGGAVKVEYLVNGSVVATSTTAPFNSSWTSSNPGAFSVQARATDGTGASITSSAAGLTVSTGNAAQFISQSVPSYILAGQTAAVSVTMKNIGTSTWSSANNYKLGSQNASDNTTWGFSRVALPQSVAPGGSVTFNFNVTAPAAVGSYNFQWKMAQDGIEWFGDLGTNAVVVSDAVPTAAISSPANGATFLPGWDVPVTVNAASSVGSISKVEVYDGSALIATLTTAPYSTAMPDVPAGAHVLTAKAYDNVGSVVTSAAVTINVAFAAPATSSGSGIPGKLVGALGVSAGGAAQYAVAIATPPGSGGMVPRVGLLYDSSGGNGVAGVGWSLSGISQITRCGRDFTHEALRSGVDLSVNDNFCMDGQRLILKPGTGAYGAAGSEYRTEIDTFAKIVAVGSKGNGPDSFLVTLRDGTSLQFGNTTSSPYSQLMLPGLVSPPGSTTPIAWALSKVSDPRSNYFTFSYSVPDATGQQNPTRIDYTGNRAAGLAPYNSVRFLYDQSRTDVETRYLMGARISASSRLTNIQTYAGTILVKDYRIAYTTSPSTARSRVQSITECADTGSTCLPPTTFSWENTPTTFGGPVIDYPAEGMQFAGLTRAGSELVNQYWADINGDGLPDRCVLMRTYLPDSVTPQYDDVLCALTQPGATPPLVVKQATYSGLALPADVSFVDRDGSGIATVCTSASCGGGYNANLFTRFLVDINGDGKVDYCDVSKDPNTANPWILTCALGGGTGAAFSYGPAVTLSTFTGCGPSCPPLQYAWADLTGDGVQSFCRIDSGTMRCRKWTPTGLAPEVSVALDAGEWAGRAWVDINGDGKADFCRVISNTPGQASGTGVLACALSTGTGFSDTVRSGTIDIGYGFAPYATRDWVDVNGDGKSDFCRGVGVSSTGAALATSTTDCVLSTGIGFGAVVSIPTGLGTAIVDPNRTATSLGFRSTILESNGDGKPDVCFRTSVSGSLGPARCLTSAGTYPDLLLGATDGLGANTSMAYLPISDASVYTKGSGATFPVSDLQDTTHVVQRVRASNGVGATVDTTYTYEGAKVDLQGRGFLGFAATVTKNPTGTVSRSETNQIFPLTGTSSHTIVSNGGLTLSDTTATYGSAVTNGNAPLASYFVFPTLTTTKTYDLNGAFINWVESSALATNYDSYGNLTQADTVYKDVSGNRDGYSQTLTTVFSNDTVNWMLGRPSTITTVSRVPGKADSTRTMARSYFSAGSGLGLLQQGIVEPTNGGTGATNLRLVNDYTYDNFGNLLTKTVSGANITTRVEVTNSFDPQGRFALTTQNALNQVETRTYDPGLGSVKTLQDPNLLTTTWTYDPFGRQLTENRADGTRTTLTYNVCAACVGSSVYSTTRADTVVASGAVVSPPSRVYYDALGRSILSAQIGFGGLDIYRETQYDSLGRVGYASANYFASDSVIRWTQFDYDPLGRAIKTTAPDNSISTVAYNGRTTSKTNNNGIASSRSVNSQGQVISIIDATATANSSSISYEYDNWGNLSKTTDAMGNVTTMAYDLLGRKTQLTDPDLGTWSYIIDNLGQTITQTDAKSQLARYTYDVLGRMNARVEPDLSSNWYYEANARGTACNKGIGKLCEATTTNGYFRRNAYDNLGRPSSQTTHVDADYQTQWTYDAAGRLDTETYPASTGVPLVVKYNYNGNGLLQNVANNATSAAYWTRNTENADGNLTTETYGNGLVGTRTYEPVTGRLTSMQAGPSGALTSVHNQGYHYDSLGRLDQRQDVLVNSSETFAYDGLDRLTTANITAAGTGTQTTSVGFNAIGNITSKTGVGTYVYPTVGGAHPHGVSSVSGSVNGVASPSYSYDLNGNMQTDGTRSFTWTSFNMPSTLNKTAQAGSPGSGISTFLYGSEHQRLKQTWVDSAKTLTTVYPSGSQFEKETNTQTGLTLYKHYVNVGSGVAAVVTRSSTGAEDTRYVIPDHLGSTSVVTDSTGAVIDRQAFDPWGDRRIASGASVGAADPTNIIQPTSTTRGYTGHEQLDQGNMGLTHMNGRVYDPTLSRFISADPNIQSPFNSQSFSRFSYVLNAPLSATDPTGFSTEFNSILWHPGINSSEVSTTYVSESTLFYQETDSPGFIYPKTLVAVDTRIGIRTGAGFLLTAIIAESDPSLVDARARALLQAKNLVSAAASWAGSMAKSGFFWFGKGLFQTKSLPLQIVGSELMSANAPDKEAQATDGLRAGANSASLPPGGPNGEDPNEQQKVYRGGDQLEARANDVRIDRATGLVKPGRGVSLSSDAEAMTQRFGSAREITSVPDELQIVRTSGNHFEIAPRAPMTMERYQQLLNQVGMK